MGIRQRMQTWWTASIPTHFSHLTDANACHVSCSFRLESFFTHSQGRETVFGTGREDVRNVTRENMESSHPPSLILTDVARTFRLHVHFPQKCKMIVNSKEELPVATPFVPGDESSWKPFSGSVHRDQKPISFNINVTAAHWLVLHVSRRFTRQDPANKFCRYFGSIVSSFFGYVWTEIFNCTICCLA